MKYEVLGFYQQRAVELGLCSDDLLVLRWFVDFAGTNKMQSMIIDNQIYYWVNYSTVLKELPILKISKQTLYKKHFTNLCNANVLIHKQVKEGGNFSYYCYGINYDTLVYLQTNDPSVKNTDLVSNSTKGCVETEQTLVSNSTEQRLVNNNIHLQDNKEKESIKEKSVDVDMQAYLKILFERIWKLYPRKVTKQKALKTWIKKFKGLKTKEDVNAKAVKIKQLLTVHIDAWSKEIGKQGEVGRTTQFIPHFSSWLNDEIPDK